MNKIFNFFIKDVHNSLNIISRTYSNDEMYNEETTLLIALTGVLAFAVNIVFLLLYIVWKFPAWALILNLAMTTCFYFTLGYIKRINISNDIKINIASAMIFVEYLLIFFIFYSRITLIYWFTFLLVLIPITLLRNKITFYYMVVLSIFTFFLSMTLYRGDTLGLDYGYIFSTIAVFSLILLVLYFMRTGFDKIVNGRLEHIDIIERQRERIMINEHKLQEKNNELSKVAFYDELTGLSNRRNIFDKIKSNIKNNIKFIIVSINIDKFKDINDSLGHSVGDKILIKVSRVLNDKICNKCDLARSSGDQFILLIYDNISKIEIKKYVRNLVNRDKLLFNVDNYEVSVSCSCGIALFPEDADNMNDLLTVSDSALYNAKSHGKNSISFYDSSMKEDVINRINMEAMLFKALEREEFYLVYQPIIEGCSGKAKSAECLLRWRSPSLGIVSPVEFIPLTEKLGIINDLGYIIMRKSIKMIKELQDKLGLEMKLSINVSVVQLKKGGFVDDMSELLKNAKISPENIIFELTESVFLEDEELMNNTIKDMKAKGFKVAIDDFGTGYSSFSYLTRLPVDILKIDKSFVDLIGGLDDSYVVVPGLIDIAHTLGMKVTAEGVEEEYQLKFLKNSNTDYIQGYYFSKPLEENDFIKFIENQMVNKDV